MIIVVRVVLSVRVTLITIMLNCLLVCRHCRFQMQVWLHLRLFWGLSSIVAIVWIVLLAMLMLLILLVFLVLLFLLFMSCHARILKLHLLIIGVFISRMFTAMFGRLFFLFILFFTFLLIVFLVSFFILVLALFLTLLSFFGFFRLLHWLLFLLFFLRVFLLIRIFFLFGVFFFLILIRCSLILVRIWLIPVEQGKLVTVLCDELRASLLGSAHFFALGMDDVKDVLRGGWVHRWHVNVVLRVGVGHLH